ncbi:MAG: right-handed parallel beta-helix repeat-containing protein [Deltaproteobacteria bacterium]|nr:MAG: right-handed parallel beta-helix repeat-containing protein [Deltaproteobacteria bacterium]
MSRIAATVLVGLVSGLVAAPVRAATYYVSQSGNDLASGSFENPWRTLAKANQTLVAGDTVFIRGGTYPEAIRPVRSGADGSPIVYARHLDEVPVLTGVPDCVALRDRSYVTIDGITCDGLLPKPDATVQNGVILPSGSYNVIQNGTFRNLDNIGILVSEGSHHNQVLGNRIEYVGWSSDAVQQGEAIDVSAANRNLFEGNVAQFAGHNIVRLRDGASYNIFRDNDFSNPWWRIVTFGGETSVYNVFEGNRVSDSRVPVGFGGIPPFTFKIWSPHNIIRRNVFHDNRLATLVASGMTGTAPRVGQNKIYHNVFYRNGRAGIVNMDDGNAAVATDSNQFVNNILYKNGYSHTIGIDLGPTQIEFALSVDDPATAADEEYLDGNRFRHNDILDDGPGETVIKVDGIFQSNLATYQSLFPDHFIGNIESDPRFEDADLADFRIQSNSACRDAGTFLTRTLGAGSGSQIALEDAGYFSDGHGVRPGDQIQLEGQTARATICSVDYAADTITVDAILSWNAGDGVTLAYEGSAPDIGAFEFGASSEPPVIFCGPPTGLGPCEDGIDNDGDGLYDYPSDPGCKHADWHTEDPQCSDGIDNDGDGRVDWDGGPGGGPVDPQCADKPYRDFERSTGGRGCGLGFELALVLALLLWLDRRKWGLA